MTLQPKRQPNAVNSSPTDPRWVDLGLMIDTVRAFVMALPTTAINHQLFNTAKARSHADEDFSAIFSVIAEMAALGG